MIKFTYDKNTEEKSERRKFGGCRAEVLVIVAKGGIAEQVLESGASPLGDLDGRPLCPSDDKAPEYQSDHQLQ